MSFADRVAARKKALESGEQPTAPLVVEEPKLETKPEPKKFGFPKKEQEPSNEQPRKQFGAGLTTPNPPASNALDDPALQEPMGSSSSSTDEEPMANRMGTYTLSSVITMANAAAVVTTDQEISEGELLISGDVPEDAIRIKQRIALLSSTDEGTLKSEMDQLKILIKAAPQACQYLLPEELGECVRALRRITDNKVAADLGRAKPRANSKAAQKEAVPKMSAEELKSIEW